MAFTRPKHSQINTSITDFESPLIRLNSEKTGANDVDVGIVFERGSDDNRSLIWDESANRFVLGNTPTEAGRTIGNVSITGYANLAVNQLELTTVSEAPFVVSSTIPVPNLTLQNIDGLLTTIQVNRSEVPGDIPTVEELELGELLINTYDGKIFYKQLKDSTEQILQIVSNVPVENTLYVQKAGSDANDGTSWDSAVATFEQALSLATARNELTLIKVGPGQYLTQGHLDMPDDCVIQAAHRTVFVEPEVGFEERNVFRMGSGCFIEGIMFEGWRLDDLDNPTEGFAVSFRPGAVIRRAPYAHKIAVRTPPTWDLVPPPLDRDNANPLVPRGAGVVLADGLVCSQYSLYPNIMTWGATPVTHNGIGYCAKNGALINAVNAVSMWAHKHFLALSGGQIILSSCSTQFGDYTMVSSGQRSLINPYTVEEMEDGSTVIPTLTVETSSAAQIDANADAIIDAMWLDLVNGGYTVGWDSNDELYTRRDGAMFLQAVSWVLQSTDETPMINLARGFFTTQGISVFSPDKLAAFVRSFEFMRDEMNALSGMSANAQSIVSILVAALNETLQSPRLINEPSVITAIGHTWTAILAGVALTKIPPARNEATIEESILELDNGVVIASGQDDQGSALFIGGMKIDADTGELTGPPFEQSVNRIATRTAIARSF